MPEGLVEIFFSALKLPFVFENVVGCAAQCKIDTKQAVAVCQREIEAGYIVVVWPMF